jgi:hypothetical protein
MKPEKIKDKKIFSDCLRKSLINLQSVSKTTLFETKAEAK